MALPAAGRPPPRPLVALVAARPPAQTVRGTRGSNICTCEVEATASSAYDWQIVFLSGKTLRHLVILHWMLTSCSCCTAGLNVDNPCLPKNVLLVRRKVCNTQCVRVVNSGWSGQKTMLAAARGAKLLIRPRNWSGSSKKKRKTRPVRLSNSMHKTRKIVCLKNLCMSVF